VRDAFGKVVETSLAALISRVSNAGAAWQGKIGEVEEEQLRESFLSSTSSLTRRLPRPRGAPCSKQGTWRLLAIQRFKQAVNPGPDFGRMVCRRRRHYY
jgi:hypothetical protein